MSIYEIKFKPSARKELNKLSKKLIERILRAIAKLQETQKPQGYKKLKSKDGFRIRIGDYRVIYTIDDENKIIRIMAVRDRKDVYR